jgi:hypothetical protein
VGQPRFALEIRYTQYFFITPEAAGLSTSLRFVEDDSA